MKPRRTHKPNIPMRDYRGIHRLIECQWSAWPIDLLRSARAAHNVLFIIARNPPHVIEAFKEFKAKTPDVPPDHVCTWDVMTRQVAEFYQRYAEWKASRGVQFQKTP